MIAKNAKKHPIVLLRTSVNTLVNHPDILFPFCILAFIQLLILEILFFAPRYPLAKFFEPLIRLDNPAYLHYPYNFILVTKWFEKIQIPIFVLFGGFFTGVSVAIVKAINDDMKFDFKGVFKQAVSSYIHLFLAGVIYIVVLKGFLALYDLLIIRVQMIDPSAKISLLKKIMINGAPVANIFISIFVTAFFAYVIPIIMIERKKIFNALIINFQKLIGSFWFIVLIVSLPALLYIPFLVSRIKTNFAVPEMWLFFLILNAIVLLLIDAISYTAITIFYLMQREP